MTASTLPQPPGLRDILRSIAVATGSYEEDALRQADAHAVLPDFSDTDAVVELLLAGS